jgi:hypothetical protein
MVHVHVASDLEWFASRRWGICWHVLLCVPIGLILVLLWERRAADISVGRIQHKPSIRLRLQIGEDAEDGLQVANLRERIMGQKHGHFGCDVHSTQLHYPP